MKGSLYLVLLLASLLCVTARHSGHGRLAGRSLLTTTTSTIQISVPTEIDPGSKIDICKVDVTQRQSCGDVLGNPVYCILSNGASGMVNYTVDQGDTLQVTFGGDSTLVVLGGSPNGGFMSTPPCDLTSSTATAPSQPITSTTLSGFTYSPTHGYCPSFVNSTLGQLAVYVFDTKDGSTSGNDYLASACTFSINLTLKPAAQPAPSPEQFFTGSQTSSSSSTTTRTEAITFTILGVAFIAVCVGLYVLLTRAA